MSRLTRSEQPWSSSVLQQVVAARDRAWGECQRGVTRSQKYRAIQRYFQEAERYEGQWLEARVVFNVHKEELRAFLKDPMYGSGQKVESMSAAEYGARFWLAWGGGRNGRRNGIGRNPTRWPISCHRRRRMSFRR